ncbi:MAG: GNAT family N-acetyltransferase [Pseudomonadota bacterium]
MPSAAPVLETERLALRPYRQSDFEAFARYFASPRSIYTDGPVSRQTAWDLFCAGAGRWQIAGHGAWTIETRSDQTAVGLVSLNTAIALPDPELGWILWEGFEGCGYAFEAAQRARDFAVHTLNWPRLISGIHDENVNSIRLAERLGATLDPDLRLEAEPETLFYRHTRPSP